MREATLERIQPNPSFYKEPRPWKRGGGVSYPRSQSRSVAFKDSRARLPRSNP